MLVLCCDAAVELVNGTETGRALLSLMGADEMVVSPELFAHEAVGVAKKYVEAGLVDLKGAHAFLEELLGLVDEFVEPYDSCVEALDESIRNSHSADGMFYLTLARRKGATLLTLDRRLMAICEQLQIDYVRILSATG